MESSVHPSVDFFLGATTPAGFKGYFAPLRREPGMQLVLLKSGPGCGKSTLMKRLARAAQEKDEPIQRIHCASDPDSLDGVVFLRQKRAIIDATAPHVVEPEAPGAARALRRCNSPLRSTAPGSGRWRVKCTAPAAPGKAPTARAAPAFFVRHLPASARL